MDPLSFASLDAAKKKRTKRGVFLAEMASVVPCVALEALIEPHYPKAGPSGGRRPFPLLRLLQKKRRSEVLRNSEIGGFRESRLQDQVDLPSMEGDLGVFAGHAPIVVLSPGIVTAFAENAREWFVLDTASSVDTSILPD